jgi:hypothetical protein
VDVASVHHFAAFSKGLCWIRLGADGCIDDKTDRLCSVGTSVNSDFGTIFRIAS